VGGKPDAARARPRVDDDIKAEILHRGVEILLDDRIEAVDLVDEEDIPFVESREDAGEITGLSSTGPEVILIPSPFHGR